MADFDLIDNNNILGCQIKIIKTNHYEKKIKLFIYVLICYSDKLLYQ